MKQKHAVAKRPCPLELGAHPDTWIFDQRPAPPQEHVMVRFVVPLIQDESGPFRMTPGCLVFEYMFE